MTVSVLLFAAYREAAGVSRMDIELNDGATVENLYSSLQSRFPRFADLRPFTSFAINREFVGASTQLSAGDEVALLQPVSGGSS